MSRVIALIPARAGSKGIPLKNFRDVHGRTLVGWAGKAAREAGIEERICSTDLDGPEYTETMRWLRRRPADLAQDDTPMIDVVQHALAQVPGEPDDIIVLLQPTQPLRKPEHITKAIELLRETQADSVVSVVPLPLTHSPDNQLWVCDGQLAPWAELMDGMNSLPATRQTCHQTYIRDGTCYAFWRRTVEQHGTIYGPVAVPLYIDSADTCELDTQADWDALEQRLRARVYEATTRACTGDSDARVYRKEQHQSVSYEKSEPDGR